MVTTAEAAALVLVDAVVSVLPSLEESLLQAAMVSANATAADAARTRRRRVWLGVVFVMVFRRPLSMSFEDW